MRTVVRSDPSDVLSDVVGATRYSHNDDDVGLHVLGCRADILGTNCKAI